MQRSKAYTKERVMIGAGLNRQVGEGNKCNMEVQNQEWE